ncbi:MAG TPA: cysteine desulfurase family protein [Candidatus Saccharicenans sp.]|nr:cysteine desulfurase family protein [Candidatus Saccharicenans sp.]HOM95036.1 cysteine desulfurase family protein [Candidatus Saccharicenans sp.]HPP24119.1 cysteine desulfurase family protein [Candidatus Saccharicenans sp.]
MIYLDNNATTPLDPRVTEKIIAFIKEHFGNPSSLYPLGREVKGLVTEAREQVATALGARRSEIIFTSSGTEADNLAILGLAEAQPEKREFITSSIEHPAVLETARYLEAHGYTVHYLPVDQTGLIDLDFLKSVISPNTFLVSVMLANNEIGTIEPVEEVVKIAHRYGVPVQTDAVQAFGKMEVKVDSLGIDLLSVSAHKVYGPKGAGALYIRKGLDLKPVLHGGHQEFGLRPGTENTSGIIGFGEAARILREEWQKDRNRLEKLADRLKSGLEKRIRGIKFNGHPEKRIKSTLNFSFPGLPAEAILLALATREIYVSTGSACTEGSGEVSHVLLALGLSQEEASSALRLSLGRFNTEQDIDQTLAELPGVIDDLRREFGS